MTPMTDEHVMRAALADLTSEQPPMPPRRFQAVRRRAVRHRKRQLAGAVVSTLAVVGIAVGAGRLPWIMHEQPQARRVPGWALPWPDYRNGTVPQSVLNNAVLAWHDEAVQTQNSDARLSPQQIARQLASYHVTWYVGQTIARGQAVAVMFEASSRTTGRVLVVGWATASQVMHGQPAWSASSSPWALTTTAAPRMPSSFGPGISEYVAVQSASGRGADTWIVVLPAPGEQFGTWTSTASVGAVSITGVQSSGVFVANVRQAESDIVLGFSGARTDYVPVGIGNVPAVAPLAPPPALTPPASFRIIAGWTGQDNQLDEALSVTRSGGPYAVLGSCYNAAPDDYGMARSTPSGHGPLQIMINGHALGTINCDGQQHELTVPRSVLRPHGVMVGIGGSHLTSWRVTLGRAG